MKKREKEDKPKTKHSAGLVASNEESYEQIADQKFAFYTSMLKKTGSPFSIQEHIQDLEYVVFPMPRPPWKLATMPEHGDLNQLYDDIRAYIVEHLYLPYEELYDVLTAWAIASWIPEAWTVVPYLFFYGVLASGKTRGLEILQRITYRGILSANFSTAALFRASELWHPTVFLDETEVYNQETRLDIIALLNCGYRRGQFVHRLRRTEHGHELESFDVFGFKALAGTESMRDTLESRSIMVEMFPTPRPLRRELDEETALNLRNRLLGFRLYQLSTVNDVNHVNLFQEYKPLEFGDGRLEELFNCLLRVVPKGRENIRNYAERMTEKRRSDKRTGVEAEIVRILISEDLDIVENFVLTRDLKEKFNVGRNKKEMYKTSSIGRIMRKLHFKKEHKRGGNGWIIDPDKLEYLKEYYEVEKEGGNTSGEGSQGSHGSQKNIDEVFYKTCILCKKPITDEPKDLNGFPCHGKCRDEFMKGREVPEGYEKTELKKF